MKLFYSGMLFVVVLFISSCVQYQSLLNYQKPPAIPTTPQPITNYQPIIIQPNDILHIKVSHSNDLAVQPFQADQSGISVGGGGGNAQGLLLSGYLVDSKGTIDFPTLGTIDLSGLSLEGAKERMIYLLDPYFEELPIVNIRLLNFRINVNGEVNNPGTFTVNNQTISIIEALTMAGDFTDYSQRDSILIVRESGGQRNFGYLDFNSADIFNSPYFYLQQNDVVYVRPDKRKLAVVRDPANRVFTWVSAITGLTAFVISLLSLRR